MDKLDIELCCPITGPDKDVLSSLTLQRIKGRDVLAAKRAESTPAGIELHKIAAMTGLPRDQVNQIDCADYLALQDGYRQLAAVREKNGLTLREERDAIHIPLWRPVSMHGSDITALTMRRPKISDLVIAQSGALTDGDAELQRYCNLCEQPPPVLEELDFADYNALDEAFSRFLSSRQRMLAAQ